MFQPAHQDITGSVFTTKKMRTGLAITLHLTCSLILLYAIKFDIETTEERFGAGFPRVQRISRTTKATDSHRNGNVDLA